MFYGLLGELTRIKADERTGRILGLSQKGKDAHFTH